MSSSDLTAQVRFVAGVKSDDGGNAVVVRGSGHGAGGMFVQMLPNSAPISPGDGILVLSSQDGNIGIALAGLPVIQDEGVSLTQRGTINFVGGGVTATDDPDNGATLVTIPGGGHLSINLPAYGGTDPVTTGFYIPVAVEQNCTIVGVRAVCVDNTGATVSDTLTFNIHRFTFSTGVRDTLNPSAIGPSSAYFYEDTTLTSWTTALLAHDSLILEVVSAPTSTSSLGVWLEVVAST